VSAAHVCAEGLGVTLRGAVVLREVDMHIGAGLTAILGPNGAGKTTLLRCVATVLAHDDGELTVDGLDPRRESERIEIRRRLGYLPQEVGLLEGSRVFDVVEYLAALKGFRDDRRRRLAVFDVLDRVGLRDRAETPVDRLSSGMHRRLGLAQALLGDPALIVLDEPAAGLDPDERIRLREILTERRHSSTIVMSTLLDHRDVDAPDRRGVGVRSDRRAGRWRCEIHGRSGRIGSARVWSSVGASSGAVARRAGELAAGRRFAPMPGLPGGRRRLGAANTRRRLPPAQRCSHCVTAMSQNATSVDVTSFEHGDPDSERHQRVPGEDRGVLHPRQRHRWAVGLMDSRSSPGMATLRQHAAMIGCCEIIPADMLAAFPHLAELTTELVLRPGYQYGDEFAFGIELVVDGLLASI